MMYVTEDTCRATPETIKRLYCTAIAAGAARICVRDSVARRDVRKASEATDVLVPRCAARRTSPSRRS
jgi:hypothetical protein